MIEENMVKLVTKTKRGYEFKNGFEDEEFISQLNEKVNCGSISSVFISRNANEYSDILVFNFEPNIEEISMYSLGVDNSWPNMETLYNVTITENEKVPRIKTIISDGKNVVFDNNNIGKFISLTKTINKDVNIIRSWDLVDQFKALRAKYSSIYNDELQNYQEETENTCAGEDENEIIIFDGSEGERKLPKIDIDLKRINYSEMSREEKSKIADRLLYIPIYNHEDYRAVINYMRIKHPEMTRGAHKIQWRYADPKKTVKVVDKPTGIESDVNATICIDPVTMEPVGFSGVCYKSSTQYGILQCGIVMFIDPFYRRMGIAQTFYTIQEEKLRRTNVRYCYEIQINGNIELSHKNGYICVNKGRLCVDGTYSQVRFLIDSLDPKSKERWNAFTNKNNILWANKLDKTFLKNRYKLEDGREYTIEELNKPWNEN